MKINNIKSERGKKTALITTLIFVFFILTILTLEYLNVTNFFGTKPYSVSAPSEDEVRQRQEAEAKEKKDFIEDESVDNASPAPIPTSSDAISISTERTGDNELTVFTKLKGYSSGECNLSISNGSKSYDKNAAVIYQPEYSTCAGFSVPVSNLGIGKWNITLTVVAADGSTLSKSTEVSVE